MNKIYLLIKQSKNRLIKQSFFFDQPILSVVLLFATTDRDQNNTKTNEDNTKDKELQLEKNTSSHTLSHAPHPHSHTNAHTRELLHKYTKTHAHADKYTDSTKIHKN